MPFATILCLIPENVYGRLYKKNGKWTGKLVASYFTVKSTDIFTVYEGVSKSFEPQAFSPFR